MHTAPPFCGAVSERERDCEPPPHVTVQLEYVPHAHTMLATHNAESLRLAREFPKNAYYTAQLLGMGMGMGDAQIDYRYVPYGSLWELSPYLLRRLWERMAWT